MTALEFPGDTDQSVIDAVTSAFHATRGGHLIIKGDAMAQLDAALLRWLLLTAIPGESSQIKRVVFENLQVAGCLDLAAATLGFILRFHHCRFSPGATPADLGIDLTDATAVGIEFLSGELGCLRANRLTLSGSLVLCAASAFLPAEAAAKERLLIAHGVLLSGARIHGNLDLRGADIHPLADEPERIAILADGVSVDGNFLFTNAGCATGEIRLNGAHIQRNFDCSGAALSNAGGYSLSAAGAEIQGSAYFTMDSGPGARATASIGMLRFDGAHIVGDLDLTGARLTATAFANPDWVRRTQPDDNENEATSFSANGIKVDATVILAQQFIAKGAVVLISAKIGSDLAASDAKFHLPGGVAFCADGADIGGVLEFSRSSSNGLIRINQAKFAQGAYFEAFDCSPLEIAGNWSSLNDDLPAEYGRNLGGVSAAGTTVGGTFIWTKVTSKAEGTPLPPAPRTVLFLAPGASVVELEDDAPSWNVVDRLDLRGAVYSRIAAPSLDIAWRIERLDREYAPWNHRWRVVALTWEIFLRTARGEHRSQAPDSLGAQVRRFSPGPYLQLAHALRSAGLEQAARKVLLRLERNRARYSGLSVAGLLWRGAIDAAIAFGAAPFRPVYLYIIPWMLISAALFKWVHDDHGMRAAVTAPPKFNAIFYSLDTLIPFVNFGQRSSFEIDPIFSWGGGLLLLNTILGYAAASFLAAGLSGLASLGKDDD